jgi:hypothetical protein
VAKKMELAPVPHPCNMQTGMVEVGISLLLLLLLLEFNC